MKATEVFLAQLEREAPVTRRVLERVPDGRTDWKPHPKSMAFGYLSSLVAMMPAWIEMAIVKDELDLQPKGGSNFKAPEKPTAADLVKLHDDGVAKARKALSGTTDEKLLTGWKLLVAERIVNESPRHAVIADTFTHLAHHRGQLSVYLRLNDVLVPSIYGPTADDKTFG
jgi:uncharacterized damage-inducible protein DinB